MKSPDTEWLRQPLVHPWSQSSDQFPSHKVPYPRRPSAGNLQCSCKHCDACHFIQSTTTPISRPKGPLHIYDHFDCTSTNVIHCIIYALCNKLYIRETGCRLGDCFWEHLLDVKNNCKDLSKPVAQHFKDMVFFTVIARMS